MPKEWQVTDPFKMTKYAHFTSQYIEQGPERLTLYACILEVLGPIIGRI
jgi:hypothetical protein